MFPSIFPKVSGWKPREMPKKLHPSCREADLHSILARSCALKLGIMTSEAATVLLEPKNYQEKCWDLVSLSFPEMTGWFFLCLVGFFATVIWWKPPLHHQPFPLHPRCQGNLCHREDGGLQRWTSRWFSSHIMAGFLKSWGIPSRHHRFQYSNGWLGWFGGSPRT